MVDLKEKLIRRIQETTNPEVLKEVYRLLKIDFDDKDIYKLSEEQSNAVQEGQEQISQGQYLTHEQANKEVNEWLKEK